MDTIILLSVCAGPAIFLGLLLARFGWWKSLIAAPILMVLAGVAAMMWLVDVADQAAAFLWMIIVLAVGAGVAGHILGLVIGLIWRRVSLRATSPT